MRTWSFPATGGTLWDDLEQDRPWFDECAAADAEQDAAEAAAASIATAEGRAELAAVLLRERYGADSLLDAAVDVALETDAAGLPAPPVPFPAPTRRARFVYDDSELTTARRRRDLLAALDEPLPALTREDVA